MATNNTRHPGQVVADPAVARTLGPTRAAEAAGRPTPRAGTGWTIGELKEMDIQTLTHVAKDLSVASANPQVRPPDG